MNSSLAERSNVGRERSESALLEVREARKCLASFERLTSLMIGYPDGHPIIAQASDDTVTLFRTFFELTDRLSLLLQSHSAKLLGTDQIVWETDDPRDYIWSLSRDGVLMVHFLAGVTPFEIREFVGIINRLVDERDMSRDAVSSLFEAEFSYISFDAVDESLAQLAEVDLDIRDRDTREEQELIDQLFDQAFDDQQFDPQPVSNPIDSPDANFRIRVQKRAAHSERLEMGSRQFLMLDPLAQAHLSELKRGFTEHAELEHREGELLAAILGAKPKERLREQAIEQIGDVMGSLLETNAPWESLEFLKLIHGWRENFDEQTSLALKNVVVECFDQRRIQTLIKQLIEGDRTTRRSILQMFNSLHLDSATAALASMIEWDVPREVSEDVMRYLHERARYGVDFVRDAIFDISPEKTEPLLNLLRVHLPHSRPMMLELVTQPSAPEIKAFAMRALAGTWTPEEGRTILAPMLEASSELIRLAAIQLVGDVLPDRVGDLIGPLVDPQLSRRSADEIRVIVETFLRYGGPVAVARLSPMVHLKGRLFSERDERLAIDIATMMARHPSPQIVELLTTVGKDWKVPSKIRSTCKELAGLLAT